MSAWGDIGPARPTGYAATAVEFLEESARAGAGHGDLGVRQLAALQGIGYALLALGEQIADAGDAAVQCGEHVAAAIEGLFRVPLRSRVLARLRQGGEDR